MLSGLHTKRNCVKEFGAVANRALESCKESIEGYSGVCSDQNARRNVDSRS